MSNHSIQYSTIKPLRYYLILLGFWALSLSHFSLANDEDETAPANTAESPKEVTVDFEVLVEKEGEFFGDSMDYEVIARDHPVKDDTGKPIARLFSLYYRKTDVKDASTRPITYIFNGGPGSASIWLHMGLLGPKRVQVPSDAQLAGAPPYPVKNNDLSLLAVSDLVFIDPMGTGYSRILTDKENHNERFYGVDEDAKSIAEFIEAHVTRYGRWASPKFILGESYGTTRSGMLVEKLQEGNAGLYLNGVMLVSAVLDFAYGDFYEGNELAYLAYLPTYAAAAHYHQRLPNSKQSLETMLSEVRQFAYQSYAPALLKGNRLTQDEQQYLSNQLQGFTGLSAQYLKQSHYRIEAFRFMKELVRDKGQVIGRFDSRYLGRDKDDAGSWPQADPSSYGITGAFTAAQQHYLYQDLAIRRDEPYRIFSDEAWANWNWTSGQEEWFRASPVNVVERLGKGLRQNPGLQIFVANGYYDLATPFFATELALTRHRLDANRIKMHYYEAGHMMYTHQPSFERLAKDLKAFVLSASNKPNSQALQ
jgi:carboxypeptidase C (cathepsin A)